MIKGALRAFTEVSALTVHNFQTLVAMGINIGTCTLTLMGYTGKKFQSPCTSSIGMVWYVASLIVIKKSPFYALFQQFPAFFLMLDFCNTRPKLLTNQERRQRLLLNEVPPFVKSGHKC